LSETDRGSIKLSFVIPAYNAADTIGSAIRSIVFPKADIPCAWSIEIIAVDDGSTDDTARAAIAAAGRMATVLSVVHHLENRGKCAATNTGIEVTSGDIVIILDADDEMVDDWPVEFAEVLCEWPAGIQVCYCACRNDRGELTTDYKGGSTIVTMEDLISQRYAGEHLPCFRGRYIRARPYVDLGLLKRPCEIVSYLAFVADGPFWFSHRILRRYHEGRPGALSRNLTAPDKAADMARCYEVLLAMFGDLYRLKAPAMYRRKLLRQAVYLSLAHQPGAWKTWLTGAHLSCSVESIGALLVLLLGRRFCAGAVAIGRRIRFIKQYG
jgi:glycosyltransferase involved in cell wall biosynthesis